MTDVKTCTKCKEAKPLDQFHAQAAGSAGLRTQCKTCISAYMKARRDTLTYNEVGTKWCPDCKDWLLTRLFNGKSGNLDGLQTYCSDCGAKRARFARTGWADTDYQIALNVQGGVCAVSCVAERNGNTLSADHCHITNGTRGLLCNDVNVGLGMLGDSPAMCISAAAYLVAHGAEPPPHGFYESELIRQRQLMRGYRGVGELTLLAA